ncbi:Nramp family divalent metal transporter [Candidatus Nomurabacteria bacterium]|nr:Nramp family divalent metal transporter [Candidatus Kaiserbacteria bacterium]MCB9811070.1 Nramp family divalent metal transporter [Candidatus Nomurabacteria bacterium]MCB9814930.1 Nramp family divalent metal transporter [Candidatus Nomurabacteria bacterium]
MTHTNLFKALGWKNGPDDNDSELHNSMPEVHKSIPIPPNTSFFKKLLIYAGPGFLVAVGYMDPGNWATSLAGGSKFGYALLSVILISNFFAMVLQHLALKLGIATGRDLAQMCKENFSKPVAIFLWLMAEVMIIATDLAEVIGSAIALNLLFNIPIIIGVIITAADVLVILLLQNKGFRRLEAFIITLIGTITLIFATEIFLSSPAIGPLLIGFIPTTQLVFNPEMLYLAIGILGATVMPHNLYLHSAIVQTRSYAETEAGKKEAIKFATIDSTTALTLALFVNAAILIVSAAIFYVNGYNDIAEIEDAYKLMAPLLGAGFASTIFAVALLAAGQNSTITGTMTGQIIMEGFLNLRIKPWLRRMITRLLAIIPAVVFISWYGSSGATELLILSQVVLSVQLSFAVFPLLIFTGNKKIMGNFVNSRKLNVIAWIIGSIIAGLNIWLLWTIM